MWRHCRGCTILAIVGGLVMNSTESVLPRRYGLSTGAVVGGGVTLKICLRKCFLITETFGSGLFAASCWTRPNTCPRGSFGTMTRFCNGRIGDNGSVSVFYDCFGCSFWLVKSPWASLFGFCSSLIVLGLLCFKKLLLNKLGVWLPLYCVN